MARKQDLLTTEEAAEILGLKPRTLGHWRYRGMPDRFREAGVELPYLLKPVRAFYRREDVERVRDFLLKPIHPGRNQGAAA